MFNNTRSLGVANFSTKKLIPAAMLNDIVDLQELNLPPPPDDSAAEQADWRLWVGNLDMRITEFSLLKILQRYGQLQKFDFLYHKSGPDQGLPRGYCFVTYNTRQEAEMAKRCLDGKLAITKSLVVHWANAEREKTDWKKVPASRGSVSSKSSNSLIQISKSGQIHAIENKLKLMEKSKTEFTISAMPSSGNITDDRVSAIPGPSRPSLLTTVSSRVIGSAHSSERTKSDQRRHHDSKPYSRPSQR